MTSARGEPDHITDCQWLIEPVAVQWTEHAHDTERIVSTEQKQLETHLSEQKQLKTIRI